MKILKCLLGGSVSTAFIYKMRLAASKNLQGTKTRADLKKIVNGLIHGNHCTVSFSCFVEKLGRSCSWECLGSSKGYKTRMPKFITEIDSETNFTLGIAVHL